MLDYDDHVDVDDDDHVDDDGDGDDGFGDVDGLLAKSSNDKTPSWRNLSVTMKLDQVYYV